MCSYKSRASLATTIYFAGVMLGGLVFGDLADRLGRLPVLLLTIYTSVAVGVATAFSVDYIMFVVLRFVQGVLMQVGWLWSCKSVDCVHVIRLIVLMQWFKWMLVVDFVNLM